MQHFAFRFDRLHRIFGMPFGVTPGTARVDIDDANQQLTARFGPWRVETPLSNVTGARVTGPYRAPKTIGPAHLSLADRGLTFATSDHEGVCISFGEPVVGIDPFRRLRHPALTVTVNKPHALVEALARC